MKGWKEIKSLMDLVENWEIPVIVISLLLTGFCGGYFVAELQCDPEGVDARVEVIIDKQNLIHCRSELSDLKKVLFSEEGECFRRCKEEKH